MRLNPQQLDSHLSSGIAPVYLISGDEPLLVDEALDALRAAAAGQGYSEREAHMAERGFDWEGLGAGVQNMSLFATRRLVEVRLPTGKPGDKGGKFLTRLAAAPVPDIVFVIITPGLDNKTQKTKWASSLAREGVWLNLKAPDHASLPRWIAGRLQRAGLTGEPAAIELLAAQVEGNLLAAKQEIDQLVLLAEGDYVTVDTVRESVANGARYDVFQLSDAALAGDAGRAVRILGGLEREGIAAPLVMWSLAREIGTVADVVYRIAGGAAPGKAMADAHVWQARQSLIGRATRARSPAAARALLRRAARTERIVKGKLRGQPWNALLELTLSLAGHYRLAAEIV
ncbi:MAG: DNA polymerase III subunit delta [Gammaproteobacteria bacterium]|nr:MAG: DNA polymerase III subunit delta [Gammaproteobacteria bacterium]